MIKVVIIDDHQIIRHGLKMALDSNEGISVVGECANAEEAIELLQEVTPDVAVIDISAMGDAGISAIRRIAETETSTKVLALTLHHSARLIKRLKDAGASGCLTKDAAPQDFANAARTVANGEFYLQMEVAAQAFHELLGESSSNPHLSDREIDVVRLVSEGHDTDTVSSMLSITPRTVQTHLYHAMKKLGLHTRHELIEYAIQEGLIPARNDA